MEYYAILKNWSIITQHSSEHNKKATCLNGVIYEDKKKRFKDGTFIHTSVIHSYDLEKGIAITRNTIYKLDSE